MLTKSMASTISHCPTCTVPLWTMASDGRISVLADLQGGDGDMIPGAPVTLLGNASLSMAYVQACPFCQGRYWTLDVTLHTGGQDALLDMLSFGTEDTDEVACYTFTDSRGGLASLKLAATHEAITHHPNGFGVMIVAGPYAVSDTDMTHGSNGVSACGGGSFWVKALARFNEEIESVTSAIQNVPELQQAN